MIWWATQPSRARSERSAIADLEETADWLRNVTWRLTDKGALCADFEMMLLDERVVLELVYPGLFPNVPPQVRPKEDVRLSGHQYGAGGELCLEFRPDNWEPSITGAMMIKSAHRLLTEEQPAPGVTGEVENAHRATVAQDARGSTLRFFVSAEARDAMCNVPLQVPVPIEVIEHRVAEHWLAFPSRIGDAEHPYWDASNTLPRYTKRTGYFIRLASALAKYVKVEWDFLSNFLEIMKAEGAEARLAKSDEELVFVVECAGTIILMTALSGSGKRTVIGYQTLDLPTDGVRLPGEYVRLAEASVAVVGCGSLGSKVAASLARAGVGRFVLIDGDILLPGNLVRNDLDWDVVGLNKPEAVKRRIEEISPSAKVIVRRLGLGGQESAEATDSALSQAGKCDVIVEATADPQVFNLCGAVARNERKVLVWGEVFAGGIGGIVARLRPGSDPVPHAARRQVIEWCADQGKLLPEKSDIQYGLVLTDDASPLVADDADVSVIAAHVTRMILDAMVRKETTFPQSAYAIGLRAEWIFAAPFDTWPILLKPEGEWGPLKDEHLEEQLDAFIKEFFPKTSDEGE